MSMDPMLALENLNKAVRSISANAETHEVLAKSIHAIKEALEAKKSESKE